MFLEPGTLLIRNNWKNWFPLECRIEETFFLSYILTINVKLVSAQEKIIRFFWYCLLFEIHFTMGHIDPE